MSDKKTHNNADLDLREILYSRDIDSESVKEFLFSHQLEIDFRDLRPFGTIEPLKNILENPAYCDKSCKIIQGKDAAFRSEMVQAQKSFSRKSMKAKKKKSTA